MKTKKEKIAFTLDCEQTIYFENKILDQSSREKEETDDMETIKTIEIEARYTQTEVK
jgi:hypothetical protein